MLELLRKFRLLAGRRKKANEAKQVNDFGASTNWSTETLERTVKPKRLRFSRSRFGFMSLRNYVPLTTNSFEPSFFFKHRVTNSTFHLALKLETSKNDAARREHLKEREIMWCVPSNESDGLGCAMDFNTVP
jgi:hypothetical protein